MSIDTSFVEFLFDLKYESSPEFAERRSQVAADFNISDDDAETLMRGIEAIAPMLQSLPRHEKINLWIVLSKALRERPDAPMREHVKQFQKLVRHVDSQQEFKERSRMNTKDLIDQELEGATPALLQEVLALIKLRKGASDSSIETALMSESSLAKDWLSPEEDEAWQDL